MTCILKIWWVLYDEGGNYVESGLDDEYRVREQLDFVHKFPRHKEGLIAGGIIFHLNILDSKLVDLTRRMV